jgi:formylmethanofuran dehydrogenase subunit B
LTSIGSSAAATCLGCGCACDDIDLNVEDNRIVEAQHACSLGVAWFGDGGVPARARTGGRDATVDEAIAAAAALLARASRPLVYLALDISCETQRSATALADALRAALDTVSSSTVMASLLAAQEIGRAGATLGEIRNRADVIVFWGVDPAIRYPRYSSRYAPEPSGLHVDGRGARTIVAVDVGSARGPADADVRIAISPEVEVATLTMARAAIAAGGVRNVSLHRPTPAQSGRSFVEGGADRVSPAEAGYVRATDALVAAMTNGRYVAIVADAEPDEAAADRDPGRAAALIALAQALNSVTRAALSMLRGGGNRVGADACLTSQTGYPTAVDFARGYPRYRPHDSGSARAGRGEVDAAIVIGSTASIPQAAAAALALVPCVLIGPGATASTLAGAAVAIDTAIVGIHEAGTALRMDDVPLPLRAALSGPPAALAVVERVLELVLRVRET